MNQVQFASKEELGYDPSLPVTHERIEHGCIVTGGIWDRDIEKIANEVILEYGE